MTWVKLCSEPGPTVTLGDVTREVTCIRHSLHGLPLPHRHWWYSDDGTVHVAWEPNASLADGEWRKETDDGS